MMYYVKVVGNTIVEGPKEMSSNESDSPNTSWGTDQLKLNGIFIVDLSCDATKEKIDYTNPSILPDSVVYSRIGLSDNEKVDNINKQAISSRLEEYPSIQDLAVALWEESIEGRSDSAMAIQKLRLAIKEKYQKVKS